MRRRPELSDFYIENDPFTATNKDRNKYTTTIEGLEDWERETLEGAVKEKIYIYFVYFEYLGGPPSPLRLNVVNPDDTEKFIMLPAEISPNNSKQITKMLIRDQAIKSIELDPRHETADSDYSNDHFPSRIYGSRIELYKSENKTRDMMADMLTKLRENKGGEGESDKKVPLKKAEE